MKTLIRVRGKRGNLKRKQENLADQRQEARQDASKRQKDKTQRLSYLENLPIELLQRIFIESRNPRLVHVSKRLQSQLLSNYTTLQLTIGCFTDVCVDDTPEDEWEAEDFAAVRRLRFLISQKWFSFPLFQAARYQWLAESSAIKIKNLLSCEGAGLSSDEKRDMNRRLWSMFDWLLRERPTDLTDDQRKLVSPIEADDGSIDENGEPTKADANGICYFERGAQAAWITIKKSVDDPDECPHSDWNEICIRSPGTRAVSRYRFLDAIKSTKHIPPSLLRPPFTQSQGDLLVNLLTSTFWENLEFRPRPITFRSPAIQDDEELSKAWESGLLYAIDHSCRPAISALIDLPISELRPQGAPRRDPRQPPPESDLWITEPLRIWQDPTHPYHQLPWTWNRRELTHYRYPRIAFTAEQATRCIIRLREDPEIHLRILQDARQTHVRRSRRADFPIEDTKYFPHPTTDMLNGLFLAQKHQHDVKLNSLIKYMYDFVSKL